MATEPKPRATCYQCGFAAPAESDEWETTTHPALGTMTQCPDCGTTEVHTL